MDALFWGLPLWWVLGLMPFVPMLFGAVMGTLLLARRGVRILPGVAPWFAFLAWLAPCALMLDTVPRLIGFAQRGANYLAVGIVLLYLVNARERLPLTRVVGGLTALWVFVVVGGYLGTFFPSVRLTTPVGSLIPESIAGNEYVRDLVFPPLAEVQTPWGADEPYERPSAPFPYTNSWGCAIALLTPVAFAQLVLTGSTRVRLLLACGMLAALVPVTQALNRGMLIGLAVAIGYVALRLVLRGRALPFLGLSITGALAVALFAALGLFGALAERAEYGSNESRTLLYRETFDRTLDSPLFGYGAPRPSRLIELSVGTQGYIWTLMFSFGFVGLALFLWFLGGAVLRTARAPRLEHLWLRGCLVGACVMIIFYGLGALQLLTVAVVAVLLLREPQVTGPPPPSARRRAAVVA